MDEDMLDFWQSDLRWVGEGYTDGDTYLSNFQPFFLALPMTLLMGSHQGRS